MNCGDRNFIHITNKLSCVSRLSRSLRRACRASGDCRDVTQQVEFGLNAASGHTKVSAHTRRRQSLFKLINFVLDNNELTLTVR